MIDVVGVAETFDALVIPATDFPTALPAVETFAVPYTALPEFFLENYVDRNDHDPALLTDGFQSFAAQTFWRDFLQLFFPFSLQADWTWDFSGLKELGNYFVPFGEGRRKFDRERWKPGKHDAELRRQLVQELITPVGIDWRELLGDEIDQPARSIFDGTGQEPEDVLGQPGQIQLLLFRDPPSASGEYSRAVELIEAFKDQVPENLSDGSALQAIRDTFQTFHRGSQFPFRGE